MASDPEWERLYAAAQEDHGFKAWLEIMDYQVEEFLTFDLSGMPEDPYTSEGLRLAEATLLETFTSAQDLVKDEASKTLFDRYARFIGQCFVEKLGGRWVDVPSHGKAKGYVGVAIPTSDMPITPYQLITAALARRSGNVWGPVFSYAEEDARDGVIRSVIPR